MPKMQATSSTLVCLSLSLHAASATAQTLSGEIYFVINGSLSVSTPVVELEMWAKFTPVPGVAEIFLGAFGKMGFSEGVDFTTFVTPPGQFASLSGSSPGSNFTYSGGQVYFPPMFPGILDNPFLLFTASLTSPDITTRRTIDLSTQTIVFSVASFPAAVSTNLPLSSVTEGSAKIHVVPSPAPLALLCLAPMIARRRR